MDRFPTNPRTIDEVGASLRKLEQSLRKVFDGGLTATITFYAASSSGGAVTVLNTVVIEDGVIKSWTQA